MARAEFPQEAAMAEPLELAGPVGFIGLGIMGSAMSAHLLGAGHRVIGYDVWDKDLVGYLSGDEAAKARAWPVLADMTREVYDVGDFGNGTKLKLVANLLVAVHNMAAAEALVLAERAGLDLATVLTAVGDGAGTSRMLEVRGPAMAAQDYAGPGVQASVFDKDISIITGFASQLRSPTPLFSLASAYYQAALAQGHGADDTSSVHAVLRALAPVSPPP
jgi:3-hydroxyisobutyrate dehydrogenase-like beta-hydroxyacid dehydrogenase